MSLADLDATFGRWLGGGYDLDAIHATLAAAAVIQLGGDPLWLLVVSGSGNAKTETVTSLKGCDGVHITSTIASEGALLSGTSKGERAEDATGGILREMGDAGVLVIKDLTSVLSMQANQRGPVLAALREIYDGSWFRKIGADGGRRLDWSGRIAVVGAVTTAWDSHHAVVSEMGDRFVLLRMDSTVGRREAGKRAIGNTRSEGDMREALSEAVRDVLKNIDNTPIELTSHELERILVAADLVTLARTAVERDRSGKVVDAHAPEMPTRFAKQLAQIVHGGVAIGMDRRDAVNLAIRCARDSMPPLRLAILEDLTKHGESLVTDVRKRLQKPHNTIDRELQALHMLGLVYLDERDVTESKTRWYYSIIQGIDTAALFPEILVPPHPQETGDLLINLETDNRTSTNKSGNSPTKDAGAMPDTGRIEMDPVEWFTDYLSNGPVASSAFNADSCAKGFNSSMFPIERFGLTKVDGEICVEDLWNRQPAAAAASAATGRS